MKYLISLIAVATTLAVACAPAPAIASEPVSDQKLCHMVGKLASEIHENLRRGLIDEAYVEGMAKGETVLVSSTVYTALNNRHLDNESVRRIAVLHCFSHLAIRAGRMM